MGQDWPAGSLLLRHAQAERGASRLCNITSFGFPILAGQAANVDSAPKTVRKPESSPRYLWSPSADSVAARAQGERASSEDFRAENLGWASTYWPACRRRRGLPFASAAGTPLDVLIGHCSRPDGSGSPDTTVQETAPNPRAINRHQSFVFFTPLAHARHDSGPNECVIPVRAF